MVPRVLIIAGPNGVGKTTFAKEYLPNEGATLQFVNADLIAAGISPFDPASADVAAGRVMLKRLDDLSNEGVDFALETTLSGMWLRDHILEWQEKGYTVVLHYLRPSSVELSLSRIKLRVLQGGHNIHEAVVRRRYARSLRLLDEVYKGVVNRWFLYDNDGAEAVLVDAGEGA